MPAAVGPGIARATPVRPAVFSCAGALLVADEDVSDVVVNGPVNNEHPLAQPVAAGPTNVGADGA